MANNAIIMVMDESGAKGYDHNEEEYPGQTGVMAGVFINPQLLPDVRKCFRMIRNKYFTVEKPHMSNLKTAEKKENLINDVFNVLRIYRTPLTYNAIYVKGFNEVHMEENIQRKKDIEEINAKSKDIVCHRAQKVKHLMYDELFRGLFRNAVDFGLTVFSGTGFENEFNINVISDTIDSKKIVDFEGIAGSMLGFLNCKSSHYTKLWDFKKKQVSKITVIMEVEDQRPDGTKLDLSGITYSMSDEVSGLTMAADVLAYSLSKHFQSIKEEFIGDELNANDSIKGHPLYNLFFKNNCRSRKEDYDAIYARDKKNRNFFL